MFLQKEILQFPEEYIHYPTFSTTGLLSSSLVSVISGKPPPTEPEVRTGDSSLTARVLKRDHIILITRLLSFEYLSQSVLASRARS